MANHLNIPEVTLVNLATVGNAINNRADGTSRTPQTVLVTDHSQNSYVDQTASAPEVQRASVDSMALFTRSINEKGAPWTLGGKSRDHALQHLLGYGPTHSTVTGLTATVVFPD